MDAAARGKVGVGCKEQDMVVGKIECVSMMAALEGEGGGGVKLNVRLASDSE